MRPIASATRDQNQNHVLAIFSFANSVTSLFTANTTAADAAFLLPLFVEGTEAGKLAPAGQKARYMSSLVSQCLHLRLNPMSMCRRRALNVKLRLAQAACGSPLSKTGSYPYGRTLFHSSVRRLGGT
ncbi:hypothetical protein GALMADRAFT_251911 [Galerina marginata CBS 339.88]|uniref:Uncharacterized protein n=1 Tax=Galerina marginata (strain CBS 339.88) TaxID=685588 RepID=A0A067STB7_GALM3|nr:hypothetical protein GALMADRAFT_251911 [Galerina marginata CBS 339.88]